MRRKIIDDSDCDPPPNPIKCRKDACEGTVVIQVSSGYSGDDSGAAAEALGSTIGEGCDRLQPASAAVSSTLESRCTVDVAPASMNALQFAAKFGRFPTQAECAAALAVNADTPLVQHVDPVPEVDDGFLWNAVPAKTCQYLDLEAVCADETSSGSSACGDSEGELTPGFVDDLEAEKENLSTDDASLLQRFFPHTAKYVDLMTLIQYNFND
jgi:hypothetical protein